MVLEHQPEAIAAWACTRRKRCAGRPVAVGLERNKGPLVDARRQDAFRVLFPIHPLPLATYHEAFTPSHAKADPTDAALPLELLRTHRDTRTPLNSQSPDMRALEPLVEPRRRLLGDNGRLTHRLTRALKTSSPHGLPWVDENDTTIFCHFLAPWSPRTAVQRARRTTLEGFLRAPHVRYAAVLAQRLRAITSATPLTTDEGSIAPTALLVPAFVPQLRVTLPAIETCDDALAQRAQRPPAFP
jgi:Transposase